MDIFHILLAVALLISMICIYVLKNRAGKKKTQLTQPERSWDYTDNDRLDAKLNSHLFKNILNSIQSHAYQTYYTIDKLSGVLDYVLYDAEKKFVSPFEEIEFVRNYIDINKIKLSPLFELKTKISYQDTEPYLHAKVLTPLVCIDLIENAFKHADIQSEDAFITILIELNNDQFLVSVSNKISEKPPLYKSHGGIGSAGFESKLKNIYGERFDIDRYTQDGVFYALLKIKLTNGEN